MGNDELASVWKALADPTRRRVLDLLREKPRTTGELCGHFWKVSRFAVMKHLSVLARAQLVLVERRGRERWNFLNAVPLQQIYERWISPYEAHWATSLLWLKRTVEGKEGGAAAMGEATNGPGLDIRSFHIEQEVAISAPPTKVFEALTTDVSAWWGAPYHVSKVPKDLVLEPKLGGRFVEVWGDGEGAIWATVSRIRRNELIELTGPMAMSGAVHGLTSIRLEASGKTTTLRLSHRVVGQVTEETQAAYSMGWKDLLGVRLKAYVESGKRYGLGCAPPSGVSDESSR